jgi:branched-chain amino acid transport system ATP-binding protein
MPLLEVTALSVSYGGVQAVSDVSLQVASGTLVGLIGANGAGKTSALDALTGFTPGSGSARFCEVEVLGMPPHKRSRLGMSRTWQSVELFDDMTIRENLEVGRSRGVLWAMTMGLLDSGRRSDELLVDMLSSFDIGDVLALKPGEIPNGHRKLVGLARALITRPKLLLADELAAGLDTYESSRLGQHLRGLVDRGLSMLLVDHDMQLVLDICDYIYVLDHGRMIAEGEPSDIASNPLVIESYLGQSAHHDVNEVGHEL